MKLVFTVLVKFIFPLCPEAAAIGLWPGPDETSEPTTSFPFSIHFKLDFTPTRRSPLKFCGFKVLFSFLTFPYADF